MCLARRRAYRLFFVFNEERGCSSNDCFASLYPQNVSFCDNLSSHNKMLCNNGTARDWEAGQLCASNTSASRQLACVKLTRRHINECALIWTTSHQFDNHQFLFDLSLMAIYQ